MLGRLYRTSFPYTNLQLTGLVLLRVLIGWHFLYEGIAKLLNPYWTSASFLVESKWFLSDLFQSIAADPTALRIVDALNVWGLIAIGLGLMIGCFSQLASIAGIVLLLLYYICAPPLVGYKYSIPMEGSYLIVNKILIEAAALFVLTIFPTSHLIGIDRLIYGPGNRGED